MVLDRSSGPARVVPHRGDQARRFEFHDQRDRDDRAGRGGRRRRPGGRDDPELRCRPRRFRQTDQLRLACRAGDRTGPARQRSSRLAWIKPGARSPRPKPTCAQAQAKLRQAERDSSGQEAGDRDHGLVPTGLRHDPGELRSRARQPGRRPKARCCVARADLEEATANLGYTTIRSPVKGIILDRRVNIGQTVVASLNAPSLFLIAKDLSRLEIWSSVNETDVGSIHVGQPVRFTVASFPKEVFEGKVAQSPAQRQHVPERRDLHRRRSPWTTPAASCCPT